jgi:tetratricopeptide (TPR) repeat protein
MKYDPIKILIIMILVLLALPTFAVWAENPQAILNQYISELQKNPSDAALREKIIKHVQTMKQKPAVPDEARKYMDRGMAAIEGGKGEEDFRAASVEFTKAANLAPWLGDAYRNLAIAQDKSGQYDAALKNLRLYLLTSPFPVDEAWAKSLINKVEYRKEKEARESSPAAIAAKEKNEHEDWLRKIDGRRYRESRGGPNELQVSGKFVVLTGPGVSLGPWEIKGRSASTPRVMQGPPLPVQTTFIISEGGDRIIERREFSDGDTREFVWVWQR